MTIKNSFILIIGLGLFVSCTEARERATEQLNVLEEKTLELNTALDAGLDRIETLDSIVQEGAVQLKGVDSLLKKSGSRIDSIAQKKAKAWEELTNF